MLPDIVLDDESFQEIVEKARKMIPGLYPDWTDYNYHDPGITFLELFAWMKEIQQFHMDQIGEEHKKMYLKLLGMQQQKKMPSQGLADITNLAEARILNRGSRFYAEEIPFETAQTEWIEHASVKQFVVKTETETSVFSADRAGGSDIYVPVFGDNPKGKETCQLGFDRPLTPGKEHTLHVQIYDEYEWKRNPVEDEESFWHLAKIRLEYLTENGWKKAEKWEDGTLEFIRSGVMRITLEREMAEKDGMYWLRFTLEECEYDVAPVIIRTGLNTIQVRQVKTRAESLDFRGSDREETLCTADSLLGIQGKYQIYEGCGGRFSLLEEQVERKLENGCASFLVPPLKKGFDQIRILFYDEDMEKEREAGQGSELPYQQMELRLSGIYWKDLKIWGETEEGSGVYENWSQVDDFSQSGPEDRHYCFDEEKNMLIFGDCENGMAPWGRMVITDCSETLGEEGNVKAGAMKQLWEDNLLVNNNTPASGGKNGEDIYQCFYRFHCENKKIHRAVTYEDYEELVRQTPGLMIQNVKALPVTKIRRHDGTVNEDQVSIVIEPYSRTPVKTLSTAYKKNIQAMLEPRRMIGTRFSIYLPEYIGISIYAEIKSDSYYEKTRKMLKEEMTDFFDKQIWEFGSPVLYSTVYGIIDTRDYVKSIKSLSINARGKGIRINRNGDVLLPANGIPYLESWQCVISPAE